MIILKLIGIASMTHLWIVSEPTQWLRRSLRCDENQLLDDQVRGLKRSIITLLNCHLCSGFWIGLFLTGNIYLAAIISVLSALIEKITRPGL